LISPTMIANEKPKQLLGFFKWLDLFCNGFSWASTDPE
jgi:hypothetical protein